METKIQESKYGLVVSSREIARELGKEHSKVLRTLDEILTKPNMASLIIPSNYVDKKGEIRKEYLLTKDGFTLYMFNIRGYNDFKMAYIQKFNEMEKYIKETQEFHSILISDLEKVPQDDWGIERAVNKLLTIKEREKMIMVLKEQNDKDIEQVKEILNFKKNYSWDRFYDFKVRDIQPITDKEEIELYVEKELMPKLKGKNLDTFIEKAIEHLADKK